LTERFDVVALGETMLSLVAEDGPLRTATSFRATHGGAESNACVALARAGLRVAWVSRLGADHAGDRIRAALEREGVDLRWVVIDDGRPTGAMFRDREGGLAYLRAGSAASALDAHDLDGVPIEDARAVLVTGITAMLGAGPQRAAIDLLDRATGLRMVDPNLRPGLWGSERAADLIRPLIRRCDIVIGGEDELAVVADGADAEELARACAGLGPTEVVVKRGAAGLAALGPDGVWREQPPVPVVEHDAVGAGDACNAAYLAARLDGADIEDALKAGAVAGAAAAAVLGDTGVVAP
jgi:2-dehydro-3-deoxygluconokinase